MDRLVFGAHHSVAELNLGTRIPAFLVNAGVHNVRQLNAMSDDDILAIRNSGVITLKVIRTALAEVKE